MTNLEIAKKLLNTLKTLNVSTICVCAGARNSPFVEALSQEQRFEVLSFFDERSCGFFALGRIKSTHNPVAVITTSGTAVGELMPAMMEGYYSQLPLIAVTADRPKNYRGTGAPQAAEQNNVFGVYSQKTIDIDQTFEDEIKLNLHLPIHFNICFDEPLPGAGLKYKTLDDVYKYSIESCSFDIFKQQTEFKNFIHQLDHIFLIIGGLTDSEAIAVECFLKKSGFPFYAEAPSQLRNSGLKNQITHIDNFFMRAEKCNFRPHGIVRIGDVPTHRLWRDLDQPHAQLKVLSISSKPFSGSPQSNLIHTRLENFFGELDFKSNRSFHKLSEEDSIRQTKVDQLLESEPHSEPGVFRTISKLIPTHSKLYLGNSLPIREWDLASQNETNKKISIQATRGLNGIDGQISYFLGGLAHKNNWALLGDLTTLYDMQGFWPLKQLKNPDFKLFVINNGGGKIFERIFNKADYYNEHTLNFKNVAALWNLNYEEFNFQSIMPQSQLIEVVPDPEATRRFWEKYKNL